MTFLLFALSFTAYFRYMVKINGFTIVTFPQNFLNKNITIFVEKKIKNTCFFKKFYLH